MEKIVLFVVVRGENNEVNNALQNLVLISNV